MFKSQDGFIHFWFADEDRYCLSDTVHLPLDKYICYLLSKKGYERIWFIDIADRQQYMLTAYGESASDTMRECNRSYDRFKRKNCLELMFNEQSRVPKNDNAQDTVILSGKKLADIVPKLLSRRKSSIVISLDAFSAVSADTKGNFIKNLIREMQKYIQCKNIMVLLSPTILKEEKLKFFRNPDNLYDNPFSVCIDENCICPEIKKIIQNENPVPLYEELAKALPGRVSVLNSLEREQITDILRSIMLQNPERILPCERTQELSAYLYCLLCSNRMRRKIQDSLIFPCKSGFGILEKELEKNEVWDILLQNFERMRLESKAAGQSIKQRLKKQYNIASTPGIMVYDSVSHDLETLLLSKELKLGEECLQQMDEFRSFHYTVWSKKRPEEITSKLQISIDFIRYGIKEEEWDFVKTCIELLHAYTLDNNLTPELLKLRYDRINEILTSEKRAKKLAQENVMQRKALEQNKEELSGLGEQIKHLNDQILKLTRLSSTKDDYVIELDREVKAKEFEFYGKEAEISACEKNISTNESECSLCLANANLLKKTLDFKDDEFIFSF